MSPKGSVLKSLRGGHSHVFFKIGVLKTPTPVFSVNTVKFSRTAFFNRTPPVAAFGHTADEVFISQSSTFS